MYTLALTLIVLVTSATGVPGSDSADELMRNAQAALRQGYLDEALNLANKAVAAAPKNDEVYGLRAAVHAAQNDSKAAIADYDRAVELDPKAADFFDRRGSEHFKLGHIDESIRDFDHSIQLRPETEPGHWRRGISYYYAGRYEEGRRQFEGYQTVDSNDVENVVWRFLCMARSDGVEKARREMLPVKQDARVPMMQIYDLFRGTATPDDVLAAAHAGEPKPDELKGRLFYAHLYIGLYYEATGYADGARTHITTAAEDYNVGHYMWHVARVHAARLKKKDAKAKPTAN